MTVVVRQAQEDDVEAVRFVGFATWPAAYGASKGAAFVTAGLDEYWNAEVVRGAVLRGDTLVAEDENGIIGMAEVDSVGDDLVMWKLYVVPSAQGTGAGTRLVDAVKQRAQDAGCDLLTEHYVENTAAAGFYARQGFVPTDAPWPTSDAVWLRWDRATAS